MYHCLFNSGRLQLNVALMTDGHLSPFYEIGVEGGRGNPIVCSDFRDTIE